MSNMLKFTCTALVGTNKVGELSKDKDGYYEICIGGIGVHNSAGSFYEEEAARHFFTNDVDLQRRISRGLFRGENGHPKMLPGMTDYQWFNRLMVMEETNICAHHRSVSISLEMMKDENGIPFFPIMASTRPSGEKAAFLQDQFDNPHENIAFSIRSFTQDMPYPGRPGRQIKAIRKVVAFDYVSEPGIWRATKYDTPSIESAVPFSGTVNTISLEEQLFSLETVRRASAEEKTTAVGMESGLPTTDLYSKMIAVPKPVRIFVPNKPLSMNW